MLAGNGLEIQAKDNTGHLESYNGRKSSEFNTTPSQPAGGITEIQLRKVKIPLTVYV